MNLLKREPESGLLSAEAVTLIYVAVTTVMIFCFGNMDNPATPVNELRQMLWWRVGVVVFIVAANLVYRRWPCRLVVLLRCVPLFACLVQWYPETYDFCRHFPYLDPVFAKADQWMFGFQPALRFGEWLDSTFWCEAFHLGYYSYYYLMIAVVAFYLLCRYDRAQWATFVFLASFFLFYFIYEFLAVAGPQYYFQAIGVDQAAQGVFPPIGDYFATHHDTLPTDCRGLFSRLVIDAQEIGERPTAAFPSSHVGMSVVCMLLAWKARNRWLFWLLMPFFLLLVFSTVYIKAHYAIDALAGVVFGIGFYAFTSWLYPRVRRPLHLKN